MLHRGIATIGVIDIVSFDSIVVRIIKLSLFN